MSAHPIDVAYGALLEVGRPDLAQCIVWFGEDGGYIEILDDVSTADEELIDKAERLAKGGDSVTTLQPSMTP